MTDIQSGAAYLPSPIPPHPRLLARSEDFERMRNQIACDPVTAKIINALQATGDRLLSEPTLERVVIGRRLLATSRQALCRISVLALLARVSVNSSYSRRAIEEMLKISEFSDWNPSHYLDTAEMALAVAIGFDWLHDELAEEERRKIANALIEKGIGTCLAENSPHRHWMTAKNNWNQVCLAGISAAAIAVADLEPESAGTFLKTAAENIAHSAEAYGPDGAYPEGPMYWDYGTTFHVILADAFKRFFGDSKGLVRFPGFDKTAEYISQMTTPTGAFFNYSDCGLSRGLELPLFWLAVEFRHPEWLQFDLEHLDAYLADYASKRPAEQYRVLALAALWWRPAPKSPHTPALHWLGQGLNPVAVHRTAFKDERALYLGIKGGTAAASHAHMDAGSFILEADGVRWAVDLPMQGYEGLEQLNIDLWNRSQDGDRWRVFRIGPDSHNILRFNGRPQMVQGSGTFLRFNGESASACSVLDLSSLYAGQVRTVLRGVSMVQNKAILFQDEWTAGDEPVEAVWQMVTKAEAVISAGSIKLTQSGETLELQVLEPAGATIEFDDISAPREFYDEENPNTSRIRVRTHTPANGSGVIRILAVPGSAGPTAPPQARPLESYPT